MSEPLNGPWVHGSPSEFGTFHVNTIYDVDGMSVAQVYELPNNTTVEDTDPKRWRIGLARARLIAAAPDLLAALIDLDEAYCDAGPGMTREKRAFGRKALMAARAAIAKATGATP